MYCRNHLFGDALVVCFKLPVREELLSFTLQWLPEVRGCQWTSDSEFRPDSLAGQHRLIFFVEHRFGSARPSLDARIRSSESVCSSCTDTSGDVALSAVDHLRQ